MKARTEAMGRQGEQQMGGGARRMAGNGPVRSLGGLWVTGRHEQSGIANNRGWCY